MIIMIYVCSSNKIILNYFKNYIHRLEEERIRNLDRLYSERQKIHVRSGAYKIQILKYFINSHFIPGTAELVYLFNITEKKNLNVEGGRDRPKDRNII